MLLDKADKEKRLQSPKNLLNNLPEKDRTDRRPLHVTKKPGTKNIPPSVKTIAGVLAKTEPIKEVAEVLEISPATVARAKNGKDKSVRSAVEQTTERIRDLALDKLMDSLGIIDDTTLANCSAKDASQVARNLAGVVHQLTPKDTKGDGNVTLVFYAPQQRKENHFRTIDVNYVE